MISVLFVCHGNICRSTMAESVFTHKVKTLGLSDQFLIDSFATSTEEIGNPPHRGTVNKLREVGIPLVPHRAKQITWADYEKSDYIIGMDSANMRNLNRMLKNDPEEKLCMSGMVNPWRWWPDRSSAVCSCGRRNGLTRQTISM